MPTLEIIWTFLTLLLASVLQPGAILYFFVYNFVEFALENVTFLFLFFSIAPRFERLTPMLERQRLRVCFQSVPYFLQTVNFRLI